MDSFLFHQINQYALKWIWLDTFGIFFAKFFEYILVFCLILLLVFRFRKYWKMVIKALISAVLARFIITNFIRWLWFRPRPFINNNINLLFNYPNEASFPSGHAAFYFAIATVVFFRNKAAGILFFLAGFLICLGRVFVGIHWPSDILAGAVIGVFFGWLINRVLNEKN